MFLNARMTLGNPLPDYAHAATWDIPCDISQAYVPPCKDHWPQQIVMTRRRSQRTKIVAWRDKRPHVTIYLRYFYRVDLLKNSKYRGYNEVNSSELLRCAYFSHVLSLRRSSPFLWRRWGRWCVTEDSGSADLLIKSLCGSFRHGPSVRRLAALCLHDTAVQVSWTPRKLEWLQGLFRPCNYTSLCLNENRRMRF